MPSQLHKRKGRFVVIIQVLELQLRNSDSDYLTAGLVGAKLRDDYAMINEARWCFGQNATDGPRNRPWRLYTQWTVYTQLWQGGKLNLDHASPGGTDRCVKCVQFRPLYIYVSSQLKLYIYVSSQLKLQETGKCLMLWVLRPGGQAKKLSDIRERDSSIKPQTCLGITKSKNGVRCAIAAWMSRTRKEMMMRAKVVIPRRRFV